MREKEREEAEPFFLLSSLGRVYEMIMSFKNSRYIYPLRELIKDWEVKIRLAKIGFWFEKYFYSFYFESAERIVNTNKTSKESNKEKERDHLAILVILVFQIMEFLIIQMQ